MPVTDTDIMQMMEDPQFAAFVAQAASTATDYDGVREYIGARYVPVFANPAEWSNTRGYEPLTIVLYQGNSFTSTQYVPTGVDINNTEFWLETGNWNAQIEAYRKEVLAFDERINEAQKTAQDAQTAVTAEVQARAAAVTAEATARVNADKELALRMDSFEQMTPLESERGKHAVFIGDSFMAPSTSYPQKLAYFVCQLTGWTLHNYAYGGAGWYDQAGASMNFQQQINKAAQNITGVAPADVDYVVIGGGFNDWNDPTPLTYNQLYSAALTTMQTAHQQFPNAKIIAIPMMFRNYGVDNHMHDLYSAICAGISASNVPYQMITNAYIWQLGFKNVDGVHPSVDLYKIMAEYVVSWVFGGGAKTDRLYSFSATVSGLKLSMSFMNSNGIMTAAVTEFTASQSVSPATLTFSSQIPLFAASSTTQRIPIINASGTHVAQVVFSGSQILVVVHTSLSAAAYAGNSVSYPLWVKNPQ